jgi:hypothetical protein
MVAGNKYTFNVTGTMDGSQITWSKDNALNTYNVFEEDGTTPAIGTDYNDITRLDVFFDGAKLSIIAGGVSDAIDVTLTPFDDITSTNVQDGMEEINTKVNAIKVVEKEILAMPVGSEWTKQTDMNVLPDADGWSLLNNTGTVSITSGILNIVTDGEAQLYEIELGNLVPANVKRIETRIKVNSNSGGTGDKPSQFIGIGDGVKFVFLMFETTQITMFNGTTSPTVVFTGDMTVFNIVSWDFDSTDGVSVNVNGGLEFTETYANLQSFTLNGIQFSDDSVSGTSWDADLEIDYIYYNVDVPLVPGDVWITDGDLFSFEATIANTLTALDTQTLLPKPTNATGLTWVNEKFRLNADRIDDNTIKIWALEPNTETFDYEFNIIKEKAGL